MYKQDFGNDLSGISVENLGLAKLFPLYENAHKRSAEVIRLESIS